MNKQSYFSSSPGVILEQVKDVLKIEAQGILDLIERVGPEFEEAVQMILGAKGRVILTGMGKSGLVGRKISATLSSTGTPSLFMHPAEAIHGDLGMVTKDDVILSISNSGNTPEINRLLPIIKKMGARIISFIGDTESPMAQISDVIIDVGVEREACPFGLAPTTSTTAALAMGDALAVALITLRRFSQKDYKKFHPGGSLGERLATKVADVMFTGDNMPAVSMGSMVEDAIIEMDSKGIGATIVVDANQKVAGILTDGDLRRALIKQKDIHHLKVEEIMTVSPKTIEEDLTAAEALGIMELYGITHLIIIDRGKRLRGVVHLHDLLGREEFKINGSFTSSKRTHN